MLVWLTACASEPPGVAGCPAGRVEVVAGVPGVAGRGEDGLPADETWLSLPQDASVGPDGTAWIADYNNHLLREVDPDGISRVVAGAGFPAGGDGGPALEEPLDHPTMASQAPGDAEHLWFAATGNHRIGRLDRRDAWIDFPVGTGLAGFAGDGGPAAEAWLWRPSSVAFDAGGTMYVSDRMNQVVRAVAPDGTITTVAGTPGVAGYSGDGGPAVEATLSAPPETETDPGNRLDVAGDRLVLADSGNDAVREVDLSTGLVRTLATGFDDPHDVAIAADGTVYVADSGNHCVRAVAADGGVDEVAGRCGVAGPALRSVPADEATFGSPVGVAVAPDGAVWVADRDNHVVRRVCVTRGG